MSVEMAETTETSETNQVVKTQDNGSSDAPAPAVNGVSNGHHSSSKHKSSSKDKHRDKDRDKDHKSSSSKSSSNRDKHHSSSSSKDKHRSKEREKDKDGKDKPHSSSGSSSRDKDKDREKQKSNSSSGGHKSSSSSSSHRDKDKERDSEKDRHREKDKKEGDKDKQRHKDHKSSSSSSSRGKDRDRHHKSSSSSSSKNKHSSSSTSSKSHHSSSSSSKDKKDDCKSDVKFVKPEPVIQQNDDISYNNSSLAFDIKSATKTEVPRNDYAESCSAYDNSSTDHQYEENHKNGYEENPGIKPEPTFNISQASSCDYSMSQFKSDEPSFELKGEADVSDGDNDNDVAMCNADNLDSFKQESNCEANQDDYMDEGQDDQEEDDMPLAKRKSNVIDDDDEDDVPLSKRKAPKPSVGKEEVEEEEDSEEDVPLLNRKKQQASKKYKSAVKKKKRQIKEEDDYADEKPKKKKSRGNDAVKEEKSPTKRTKKQGEEEEEVWRWWEEEKRADGVKWTKLEHKGPVFAAPYEPLPKNVRFFYDGKEMRLTEDTEEAATFYAKMLNHDYVTKQAFNDNFFKDFRKTMTSKEREIIKDLKKCNFEEMFQYFTAQSEQRKNSTKEEKNARKAENEALLSEYGFCLIDGHKEKIGNFKLEPPGLFRGRGEHPKMGMIKRRIRAEDVSINCGKDSNIPAPPKGHKWKDVRHDNTVTWLASWTENVQGQVKYIMLNPSSKLKGEKDHVKYETARKLHKHINKIRSTYRDEWKSKEMRVRQRAVALYFIDKLALRAGNEKDEDQADTVGCCSLRVEHVSLHKAHNGKENVVIFDFLGKDSIRYYNEVEVEKRVFKNLELFMENKKDGDDLFDRLNTQVLNEHLKELMEGLTAKVFRTYNASITLQAQLDLLTEPNSTVPEKLLAYNRANRAVAILCNHQRSVPKGHAKSMENLKEKIRAKREAIDDAESEYHDLKKAAKRGSVKERIMADKKQKQLERMKEQLKKFELQETDRDENKTIALGTSKLNYLDPRISVAWCKKYAVPIEKIFNKTQRDKFRWAIHMADEHYRF